MKPEKNNTFCEHPFRQITAKKWDWSNNLEEYTPCCQMMNIKHPKLLEGNSLSPDQAFNSPEFQKLRDDLSNNIRHPSCATCWDMEDRGLKSFRETSIERFDRHFPRGLSKFDITLSTLCNLRCRMCSPSTSHSLQIDMKGLRENGDLAKLDKATHGMFGMEARKLIDVEDSPQIKWLMENTDKIKVLRASGGEPFYDKKIVKVLRKYVETGNSKDTFLQFHTNGTQFIKEDIVELNSQFRELHHTISIDGIDETYEYIRYGSFSQLEDSIDNLLKRCNNIGFLGINFVVSAFNVLNAGDFAEWAKLTFRNCNHHINFSQMYPYKRGTSLYNLPISILKESKKRTKHFQLIEIIDDAIENNSENPDAVLAEAVPMDKVRNQSYRCLDPILVDWLDS